MIRLLGLGLHVILMQDTEQELPPVSAAPGSGDGSRRSYTATFKLSVCAYAEDFGNRAAGRHFGISESIVRRWRTKKPTLETMPKSKKRLRDRVGKWPSMEEKLIVWVQEKYAEGHAISSRALKAKARILTREAGVDHFNFKATSSWMSRFLDRHNLTLSYRPGVGVHMPQRSHREEIACKPKGESMMTSLSLTETSPATILKVKEEPQDDDETALTSTYDQPSSSSGDVSHDKSCDTEACHAILNVKEEPQDDDEAACSGSSGDMSSDESCDTEACPAILNAKEEAHAVDETALTPAGDQPNCSSSDLSGLGSRRSFTAAFKLSVCSFAEDVGNRAAGRHFGIAESAVRRWRTAKPILEKMPKTERRVKVRKGKWPTMEKQLIIWVREKRAQGHAISSQALKLKARVLTREAGVDHFRATSSWVNRFLGRHNLTIRQQSRAHMPQRSHRGPDDVTCESESMMASPPIILKVKEEHQDDDETALASTSDQPGGSSGDLSHDPSCDQSEQETKSGEMPYGVLCINSSADLLGDLSCGPSCYEAMQDVAEINSEDQGLPVADLPSGSSGDPEDMSPDLSCDQTAMEAVEPNSDPAVCTGPDKCEVCGSHFSTVLHLARHLKLCHAYIGEVPTADSPHDEIMRFVKQRNVPGVPSQLSKKATVQVRIDSSDEGGCSHEFEIDVNSRKQDSHENKRFCVCHLCGKNFSIVADFSQNEHETLHVCGVCGRAYASVHRLRSHKVTHKNVCKDCGKEFETSGSLWHHRHVHRCEKRMLCEICGKKFYDKFTLKQHHLHMHDEDYLKLCDICGQEVKTSLRDHQLNKHSGEKPYVCDTCGRAYSCSASLKAHKRSHTDVKPHVCHICGKAFRVPGQLRQHTSHHK